jgi:hypothetical protein
MKGRKFVYILSSMLVLSSIVGALSSANTIIKSNDIEPEPIDKSYSHTVFSEFFTMTTCVPCKYVHQGLYKVFWKNYHPFWYITYVYNKNNNSNDRKKELGISASPTTMYDGGYIKVLGGSSIEEEMAKANSSIIDCGNRNVKDIELSLDVEWLGAVNPTPLDGMINVPVEQILSWTCSEMVIDVEVKNNESSQYNGHLHVQVTEVNSTWWDDKFGEPYTFEFKDWAFNEDVSIGAGGTWSDSVNWDAVDHHDEDDPPRYFDHLTQDNVCVIGAVFDEDNDDFVDETAGFFAGNGIDKEGEDNDPKTFDIYFGDTNPPPQIASNTSSMSYPPHGNLNWSTEYYWKIDVWHENGNKTPGDLWSFTTRGNTAPDPPLPVDPEENETGIPIDTNLTWSCFDPEGDDMLYDVYFDEWAPGEQPEQVEANWSNTTYDPTPFGQNLEFGRRYHWKIVAWEEYGENSTGGPWTFTTEENKAPNPAHDPIPPDGANNVPGDALLYWNGSDPNSGDSLKYDVFFSISYPPVFVSGNQTDRSFDPYDELEMPLFEEYYWKIVTWDRDGLHTPSPIWSFRTGINPKPTNPVIDGPARGIPGVDYNFTFVSSDTDNNTIKYIITWDDGNSYETDYYESEVVVELSHNWTDENEYTITAIAEDNYGERSGTSTFKINIPRSRTVNLNNNLLSWLYERFPYMFQILRYLFAI